MRRLAWLSRDKRFPGHYPPWTGWASFSNILASWGLDFSGPILANRAESYYCVIKPAKRFTHKLRGNPYNSLSNPAVAVPLSQPPPVNVAEN